MTQVSGHVQLAKRKRGDAWYMKYRLPDGRQVQKKLGPAYSGKGRPPAGHFTRKTAESELHATLTDARRGALPVQRQTTGATFSDAADAWLAYCKPRCKPSTIYGYTCTAGMLKAHFGDAPVAGVTTAQIDAYLDGLDRSARTKQAHLIALTGIFNRARKVYGLTENPASLADHPVVRRESEPDPLTPDEVWALSRAAIDDQERGMYLVSSLAGLRPPGEVYALRWRDVDFVNGNIHVRRGLSMGEEQTPKSNKGRTVPMAPQLAEVLARVGQREHFTADGDLVFCDVKGEHLDPYKGRDAFYAALKRAGLRKRLWYDLRHTFGTNNGMNPAIAPTKLQAWMGHANLSTTERYITHRPQPGDAALLSASFKTNADRELETMSRTVSRTAEIQAQLTATDSNGEAVATAA